MMRLFLNIRLEGTKGLKTLLASALLLLLAVLCPCARAEAPSAAFEAANKLYYEGKFADAASAYGKMARSGMASAAIYFNLGNAFFKSGQIGRAIAAYHQAEALTPRDPDVRANLQFARNQAQGPTLQAGSWQRWLGRLSLNEWAVLAAAAFWLWLLLLALVQWRPALKASLRGGILGMASATILLSACLGAALYENRVVRQAIVIVPEAAVRLGPLEESQSAFTVHDGAELRVLDQKDQWLQVSAGPGRLGWLRRDQISGGVEATTDNAKRSLGVLR